MSDSSCKHELQFGYRKKDQRFTLRRYPGDQGHVETDLVSLTPDEAPAPPPKPAKNFIRRNKEKLAAKGRPDGPNAITLTQEQLNAILRSVGKVAGGHKNAIKISIDKKTDKNSEITLESPRRKKDADYNDDDDQEEYEDRREKKRNKKKRDPPEDESAGGSSIYDLLNKQSKPKNASDNESYDSDESLRMERRRKPRKQRDNDSYNSDESLRMERQRKPRKQRKDRQSRRKNDDYDDDYEDELDIKTQKSRSRKTYNHDDEDDDDRDNRRRRTKSKNTKKYASDDEEEIVESRGRRNRSKPRNYDDNDLKDEEDEKENRRRNVKKNKKRDDSYDDDIDNREYDRRERTRKHDKSRRDQSIEKRDRSEKRDKDRHVSNERDSNLHYVNKTEDDESASPRDKIGLPNDLSWRHMSKAERKRLEMARQKFLDEEEKREEDRVRQLQYKYGGASTDPISQSPPKRIVTRSDPATRIDRVERGRETDLSTRTDHYRRDRKSLSPNETRSPDRSPEVPYNPSPDTSPKAMPVPQRHLSLAERKRLEWERERVESKVREQQETWDPWGRPGAGAPLRSKSGHVAAEYRGRQDQMKSITIEEEEAYRATESDPQPHPPREKKRTPRHQSPPPLPSSVGIHESDPLPHAMRSSFVLGQAAPDFERFNDTKEREKKQWLADLQKQIDEKKAKDMKQADDSQVADTWADKFSQSHRASNFQEQPKGIPANEGYTLPEYAPPLVETYRTSSAPMDGAVDESATHIRGQNAPIDPITKKELEDKRRIYMEHQMAIKAQVEEKERLKRIERERKRQEDMEEERKLQAERDSLKQQFENEQQKQRQKEAQKQAQVNQLKAAMDEAQASALQEKYQRKLKHLEAGGHDTTNLREHLEGEITSRIEQLHTRRERDVQRAQQLLDLQFWGLNKIEEEGGGETETAKLTPRSDPPDTVLRAPSHVPGLDLRTSRTNHPHYTESSKQEPDHDPYVEDRVLTPSRFRHPSKPWSDPSSPRREFGTQTGNRIMSDSERDVDNIKNLMDTNLPREESEVQIEYRMDKKVRVVSAPKEMLKKRQSRPKEQSPHREQPSPHQHHHEVQKRRELIEQDRKKRIEQLRRKGPVKPGSRPKWGYKNMENKQAAKNSERDPFYERKKRESQMRRYQREQKLLAMVEANKQVIPKHHMPAHKSRDPSPYSDYEHESIREARVSRRSQSHSPHRTLSNDRYDYLPVHDISKPIKSDTRRKSSRSPQRERDESPPARQSRARQKSPPVPAIKHRTEGGNEEHKRAGKYRDEIPLDVPIENGKFVPFTRTLDVLDPAKADEPLHMSREATLVANARKQYYENLHPEKFGNKQAMYQDTERNPIDSKDPLMNPGMVRDYPTSRQDQILIQLSTLKQSLMQRQRELETFSPSDLEKQDIPVLG